MALPPAELKRRKGEQFAALEYLGTAISMIDSQGREPDNWERERLVTGLSAFFNGLYCVAQQEAQAAMIMPPESSIHKRPSDFEKINLQALKQLLSSAKVEPLVSGPFGKRLLMHERTE